MRNLIIRKLSSEVLDLIKTKKKMFITKNIEITVNKKMDKEQLNKKCTKAV